MNPALALRMALHSIHILPNAHELQMDDSTDWINKRNALGRLTIMTDDSIPQMYDVYRIDSHRFLVNGTTQIKEINHIQVNSLISSIYPRITHLVLDTKAGDKPVVIFSKDKIARE